MRRDRVVLAILACVYFAIAIGHVVSARGHPDFIAIALLTAWLAVFALVGGVIALRRPRHTIGWLMLGLALAIQFGIFTKDYAHLALIRRPGELPFGDAAAWGSLWIPLPGAALFAYLLLVFPSGRLPSPRWRRPTQIAGVMVAFATLSVAVRPGAVDGLPGVDNPLGIEGAGFLFAVARVLEPFVAAFVVAIVVSLFRRARRSTGVERQQLKVVAYAAALLPVAFVVGQVLDAIFPTENSVVLFVANLIGLTGIPVAIGIAILRYRLYDIDVVINRTIVYALLTAVLVSTYVGAVALLQGVVPVGGSDLAVAGSTLAVAALFNPLRRRIQGFIDHQFYRRKYDARHTVAEFSARLRDEVDIDELTSDLVGVVRATVQPATISLWLRTK